MITGLNKLLWFAPMPPMSPALTAFMGALKASGYFFPFLGIVEIAGGVLFLANRFLPFALVITAPVVVNILAVHTFLDPRVLPLAVTLVILEVYLAWIYRDTFRPMFVARPVQTSK